MMYQSTEYLSEPLDRADLREEENLRYIQVLKYPEDDGIMHIETIERLEAIVKAQYDSD